MPDGDVERELQRLLDLQCDSLEQRSPQIGGIRRAFLGLLTKLERQTWAQADAVDRELTAKRAEQARAAKLATRLRDLNEVLHELKAGPWVSRITELDSELTALDDKIAKLELARKSLREERRDLESLVESREARVVREKAALGDAPGTSAVEAAIITLSQKRQEFDMNIAAIDSGKQLWSNVCAALDELDETVSKLSTNDAAHGSTAHDTTAHSTATNDITHDTAPPPGSPLAHNVAQVLAPMRETLRTLESCHATAEKNRWSLLVVAIGHEVQALQVAIAAIVQYSQERQAS